MEQEWTISTTLEKIRQICGTQSRTEENSLYSETFQRVGKE